MTAEAISGNETELQRLRRELDDLREQFARHQDQSRQRFLAIEERIAHDAEALGTRIAALEAEQRQRRRSALLRELRGAQLFTAGFRGIARDLCPCGLETCSADEFLSLPVFGWICEEAHIDKERPSLMQAMVRWPAPETAEERIERALAAAAGIRKAKVPG